MTDSKGAPVRSPNIGEKILHKMRDGDDAPAIAKRLTMEVTGCCGVRLRRQRRV
jgi:hypothetical protein